MLSETEIRAMAAENEKLKNALLLAMPWIGVNAEGPEWATADAKQRNRASCERALDAAMDCFPDSNVFYAR